MKIILDFDDTIFNTHQLIQEFFKIFQKEGFTEEQFWNVYQKNIKEIGSFDKNLIIDLLFEINIFDKEKIQTEINFIIKRSEQFVYTDFFDFILKFKKEDLILLSYGAFDFQKIKIDNSGVSEYFSEVIITLKNKADRIEEIKNKDNETFVFIEDKAESIDDVKRRFPNIVTMKMTRPQGRHSIITKLTDYVIQDLNEARNIINDLNE